MDNDCNGEIDDGLSVTPTECGVGVCASTGELGCVDGVEVDNCTPGEPTGPDDDCDDIDQNCNGVPDENFVPIPTDCGLGECASTGELICDQGSLVDTCVPGDSTPEVCDGMDNDCNGAVDDGLGMPTECGIGECFSTGELLCDLGEWIDTCVPREPSDELCDDGLDNDCDGEIDEGCGLCPIADAGDDKAFCVGEKVGLDGSGSYDPDGGILSYAWSVIIWPDGCKPVFSDPAAVDPWFIAECLGDYVFELVVTDGLCESEPDTVVIAVPDCDFVCPKSQGFWKNHHEIWPVESLMLGGESYTKAELILILRTRIRRDASLILARQLIAAKLNIANGSEPAPIGDVIDSADELLSGFDGRLPYGVRPFTQTGAQMVVDALELDRYNNGMLTPDCEPWPVDVKSKVRLSWSKPKIVYTGRTIIYDLRITNISSEPIYAPVGMIIESISPLSVRVIRPEATVPVGRPFINFTDVLSDDVLLPGETTETVQVEVFNPALALSWWNYTIWGGLTARP